MIKKTILTLLIMFAISSAALASSSQSMLIKLSPGDPGDSLKVQNLVWPDWIDEAITKVNQGYGEFFVKITNDSTEWQLINWLEDQPKTGISNYSRLDKTLDGALNVARFQNVIRLFKSKGLSRLALSHIPDRDDSVYIEIYYEEGYLPDSNKSDTVCIEHTELLCVNQYYTDSTESLIWSIGVGGELAPVSDGKPIVAPAVSLSASKRAYLLSITGAYRSKGELDQKFVAGSAVYFPSGKNIGLMIRFIYASEAIKTHNAYLQQGFGPVLGLMLRSDIVNLHLGGGFQYFDRYQQDRRIEATVNFGFNIKVKSF